MNTKFFIIWFAIIVNLFVSGHAMAETQNPTPLESRIEEFRQIKPVPTMLEIANELFELPVENSILISKKISGSGIEATFVYKDFHYRCTLEKRDRLENQNNKTRLSISYHPTGKPEVEKTIPDFGMVGGLNEEMIKVTSNLRGFVYTSLQKNKPWENKTRNIWDPLSRISVVLNYSSRGSLYMTEYYYDPVGNRTHRITSILVEGK